MRTKLTRRHTPAQVAGTGDFCDRVMINGEPKETTQITSKEKTKIDVLFKPVGDTPVIKKPRWKMERTRTISSLVNFLQKYLDLDVKRDSIFLYVSSSFAPSLDTEIGTLFDCFSAEGTLILQYCKSHAWG